MPITILKDICQRSAVPINPPMNPGGRGSPASCPSHNRRGSSFNRYAVSWRSACGAPLSTISRCCGDTNHINVCTHETPECTHNRQTGYGLPHVAHDGAFGPRPRRAHGVRETRRKCVLADAGKKRRWLTAASGAGVGALEAVLELCCKPIPNALAPTPLLSLLRAAPKALKITETTHLQGHCLCAPWEDTSSIRVHLAQGWVLQQTLAAKLHPAPYYPLPPLHSNRLHATVSSHPWREHTPSDGSLAPPRLLCKGCATRNKSCQHKGI